MEIARANSSNKSTKKGKLISSPDELLKTGKDAKIEHTEEKLKKGLRGALVDPFKV